MTTARWEAPYIAEWLAYHRAIGFDHVYLYCNDDDPGELYTAASGFTQGSDPFVTFVHCPHQGQQWWMFLHFLQTHRAETEWVAFLDVDEFLSLRRDADLHGFMQRRPADADSIYFHWAMFGHAGFAERPPGSVLRQYTRRAAGLNPYTKTITLTARIDPGRLRAEFRHNIVYPHHGWDEAVRPEGFRTYDVLGAPMDDYWNDHPRRFETLFAEPGRAERVWAEAVVHHYVIRSEADFRRRVQRGLGGDFGAQSGWGRREAEGGAPAFLAELDEVEDRTLADWWERRLDAGTAEGGMYPSWPAPLVSRGRPCLQSSVWTRDGSAVDPAEQAGGAEQGSGAEPADRHDALSARETALDVESALALLTVEQRTAILLVDVHGLPVDEAAAVLGVPVGTVKSRCSRRTSPATGTPSAR